jgi:hypothetical protein
MNEKISEILDGFKIADGIYKRELIDSAIELKDEISPYLVKVLENVLSNPEKYIENEKLVDHVYSIMLLGHFRESKAHKVIVDLCSLPDDMSYKLYGDLIAGDLPTILVRTCNRQIDLIKSMVLNKNIYGFCRIAAANAMTYAVLDGIVTRKEVLSFFGTLFTGTEADDMPDFWSILATYAYYLYPKEIMHTIKQAYDDGLIFSGAIGYGEFEEAIEDGEEKCLERLKNDYERGSLDDIHDSMSWWACFDQAKKDPVPIEAALHSKVTALKKGKTKKIGRNAPCPCGSGKKYKKCCLNKN